jgi:hypothetical protein
MKDCERPYGLEETDYIIGASNAFLDVFGIRDIVVRDVDIEDSLVRSSRFKELFDDVMTQTSAIPQDYDRIE